MKKLFNKNWLVSASVLAVALMCGSVGEASPLAPGGSITAPGEGDPVGATLLFTTNVNFSSTSFSGVLTSKVLTGDTSNPYGLGRLTFTYEYALNALSPDSSSAITIGSFKGFLTDVSYQTPLVGLAPGIISRNPTGNQSVKFDFSSVGYLLPGMNSALLVIQTDATAWTYGTASILDNTASPNATTVVPVPEPSSAGAMLLGLGALVCSWRAKHVWSIKRNQL